MCAFSVHLGACFVRVYFTMRSQDEREKRTSAAGFDVEGHNSLKRAGYRKHASITPNMHSGY